MHCSWCSGNSSEENRPKFFPHRAQILVEPTGNRHNTHIRQCQHRKNYHEEEIKPSKGTKSDAGLFSHVVQGKLLKW